MATSESWPADTIVGRVGDARAVVLVEGISDQLALERLAERRGRDLAAERVAIVPTGGVTSIGRFLGALGPHGIDVALAGLCDAGEERHVQRSLERAGLGAHLDRATMEACGFFVCVADLEEELIRALGADGVIGVLEADGELASFRTFQKQPAQRERTTDAQLRRFMGTRAGRKYRYATLLVHALELARMPRPLDAVLAHV
jgi:hypothetical protein